MPENQLRLGMKQVIGTLKTHLAEFISINNVQGGSDSGRGIGDSSEPRIPTGDDIAIRAKAGIAATFSQPMIH